MAAGVIVRGGDVSECLTAECTFELVALKFSSSSDDPVVVVCVADDVAVVVAVAGGGGQGRNGEGAMIYRGAVRVGVCVLCFCSCILFPSHFFVSNLKCCDRLRKKYHFFIYDVTT